MAGIVPTISATRATSAELVLTTADSAFGFMTIKGKSYIVSLTEEQGGETRYHYLDKAGWETVAKITQQAFHQNGSTLKTALSTKKEFTKSLAEDNFKPIGKVLKGERPEINEKDTENAKKTLEETRPHLRKFFSETKEAFTADEFKEIGISLGLTEKEVEQGRITLANGNEELISSYAKDNIRYVFLTKEQQKRKKEIEKTLKEAFPSSQIKISEKGFINQRERDQALFIFSYELKTPPAEEAKWYKRWPKTLKRWLFENSFTKLHKACSTSSDLAKKAAEISQLAHERLIADTESRAP